MISEDDTTNPINPYGMSKLMSENIIKDSLKRLNSRFIIFRYFNVAGSDPNNRTGQISNNATHLIKLLVKLLLEKKK